MMIRTVTTSLVLLFSTTAFAGDMNKDTSTHSEQVQKDFQMLDQDRNGLLNRSEVREHPELVGSFVTIDLNDNNDIDMDEFLIYRSEATAAGQAERKTDNNMDK